MLHKLKLRAESFDNWVLTVKNALDLNASKKLGKNVLYVIKLLWITEWLSFPAYWIFAGSQNCIW
jgi:hypothetical protein